jgi:hypothetical protein
MFANFGAFGMQPGQPTDMQKAQLASLRAQQNAQMMGMQMGGMYGGMPGMQGMQGGLPGAAAWSNPWALRAMGCDPCKNNPYVELKELKEKVETLEKKVAALDSALAAVVGVVKTTTPTVIDTVKTELTAAGLKTATAYYPSGGAGPSYSPSNFGR